MPKGTSREKFVGLPGSSFENKCFDGSSKENSWQPRIGGIVRDNLGILVTFFFYIYIHNSKFVCSCQLFIFSSLWEELVHLVVKDHMRI